MANKYATATGLAGAISQDPNEIDINASVDTGVTGSPRLASPTVGGGTTTPNFGFAGAALILDDTAYVDDADASVGSVSKFAPGHGSNHYPNEKNVALDMGGILPGGTAAVGTLTIAEPVTSGDTFTIGTTVYTMMTTPAAAYDVAIGAGEAATKVNIVAAINLSGTPGTEYFAGTVEHPDVVATAFATDDCVLTAKQGGLAGDAIATTETFTHASNIFDAATLGAVTAGVDFAWVGSLGPVGISADVALVDQNA